MRASKSLTVAYIGLCSIALYSTEVLAQASQAPVSSPAAGARSSAPDAAAPYTKADQAVATVNAPVQLLGVPVYVAAPDPISYTGSAYQDDLSGQSESNSDPAITESVRATGPSIPDAW